MGLVSAVKYRSARAIKRALMCVIGAIFLAVGTVFLTSAGWIVMAEAYSPLFAALVLAGIFLGIGLVILGIASGSKERHRFDPETAPLRDPTAPPTPGSMSPLAEAFIIGLNAAHAARGRR
jgi:vacuolar-type H+-ATPase subunit I/STV1